jgi:hypothetical protein
MSAPRCRACQRINPPEALFCYHDGAALDSAGMRGPVAAGAQPFQAPFVFPDGRRCRSFDELVLACEDDWQGAKHVLQQGYLEGFLGALGRLDLAQAARRAARSADRDRALDELLDKLPNSTRTPARLQVQPREMNLGQLACGAYRRFILQIENGGMGLLHGSVSCPGTPWLAVGDAAGGSSKLFSCRHETVLTVQVVGKALRAGVQPLRGRVLVQTNGGTVEIPVSVQVPVTPFGHGVLAGATTPRQVAEKAKAAPKAAAALFARGAVAAWYVANGWTYPVQGPAATGLGAVQQFFEALGLVAPPKVEISAYEVQFFGGPGGTLEQIIQVQTVEKRPVFAYGVSSVPWLQVGKAVLDGRTARIPLRVGSVPALPGETLRGQVHVTANGNQRFTVAVTLTIAGTPPAPRLAVVELTDPVPPLVAVEIPLPAEPIYDIEEVLDPPAAKPIDGDHRKPPPRRRPNWWAILSVILLLSGSSLVLARDTVFYLDSDTASARNGDEDEEANGAVALAFHD